MKFLVLFILLIPISLLAQDFRPGFIIRNNGDSIPGLVSYRLGNKNMISCTFKSDEKTEAIVFNASEIQGYGFYNDRRYESIRIPKYPQAGELVFAKVLTRGQIKLYRLGEIFALKKNDTIIGLPKPEDKIVKIGNEEKVQRDKRYVRLLNFAISDCSLNANSVSYAEGPLQRVIEKYNACKGFVREDDNRPFLHLNGFVFSNYTRSKLDFNYLGKHIGFSPSNSIAGGGGIDISSPRIFDKAFLSIELWYSSSFY